MNHIQRWLDSDHKYLIMKYNPYNNSIFKMPVPITLNGHFKYPFHFGTYECPERKPSNEIKKEKASRVETQKAYFQKNTYYNLISCTFKAIFPFTLA